MREINVREIKEVVKNLLLQANYEISPDILRGIKRAEELEESPAGKAVFRQIITNCKIAKQEQLAICQDTGLAMVFIKMGQEVCFVGGDLNEAINEGVKEAYTGGYLRKSVVTDPLFDRKNTKENTPAIVYIEMVAGSGLHIQVIAKGFGSEIMSRMKVLIPADSIKGFKEFVIETVKEAGPNSCPPVIVGVGVGGTIDKAALIAKRATVRELGKHHEDPRYAKLESELLQEINALGIGPAGLGGSITALAVNIEYFPTHIGAIPVVVNLCCHASRHAGRSL